MEKRKQFFKEIVQIHSPVLTAGPLNHIADIQFPLQARLATDIHAAGLLVCSLS